MPIAYIGPVVMTKDQVLSIPTVKEGHEVWNYEMFTEEYQKALEEGVTEYICTDRKRTEKDILHKANSYVCPIIRESHYTRGDKEFLEVFKDEILLGMWHLEIPKKLGDKIYNHGYKYNDEVINQAKSAPNRNLCIVKPEKNKTNKLEIV